MFTRLDYSSALEYSIIRRYTNIVYYYYIIATGDVIIEHFSGVRRVILVDQLGNGLQFL